MLPLAPLTGCASRRRAAARRSRSGRKVRGVIDLHFVAPGLAVGARVPDEAAARLAREHGISAGRGRARRGLRRRGTCSGAPRDPAPAPPDAGHPGDPAAHAPRRRRVRVRARSTRGERVLIHCQYGIGRSALLALCVLVARGARAARGASRARRTRGPWSSPSPEQLEAFIALLRAAIVRPSAGERGRCRRSTSSPRSPAATCARTPARRGPRRVDARGLTLPRCSSAERARPESPRSRRRGARRAPARQREAEGRRPGRAPARRDRRCPPCGLGDARRRGSPRPSAPPWRARHVADLVERARRCAAGAAAVAEALWDSCDRDGGCATRPGAPAQLARARRA